MALKHEWPPEAISINDIVEVTKDFEEHGVSAGEHGTVVDCFDYPWKAYEVEFISEDGIPKAQFGIEPENLKRVRSYF